MILFFYSKGSNTQIVRGSNIASELNRRGELSREFYMHSKLMRNIVLHTKSSFLKKYLIFLEYLVNKFSLPFKYNMLKKYLAKSDIVIIPKRVEREQLKVFRAWKSRGNKRVIYDLDDYIWSNSFKEGEYFQEIVDIADLITVDNQYLQQEIYRRYGANTELLLPYYNQKDYFLEPCKSVKPMKVGWLGSKSTFHYIKSIEKQLLEALDTVDFELHLAGVTREDALKSGSRLLGDNVFYHGYYDSLEMYRFLNSWHLGLFPIDNSKDGCGRGLLKIFLYLGSGCNVLSGKNINTETFNREYNCIELVDDLWKESIINYIEQYVSSKKPSNELAYFLEQFTISTYTQKLQKLFSNNGIV